MKKSAAYLVVAGLVVNLIASSVPALDTVNKLPTQLDSTLPSFGGAAMLAGVIIFTMEVL